MKIKKITIVFLILIAFGSVANAQEEDLLKQLEEEASFNNIQQELETASPTVSPANSNDGQLEKTLQVARQSDMTKIRLNEESNRFRLIACGIVSLMAIFTILIVLRHVTKVEHTATNLIHISGLILIVFGTIILVIVADGSEQLTAPIGVLGAIAGYLFGKMDKVSTISSEHSTSRQKTH